MEYGQKIAQIMLIALNVIFLILGIILMVVGALMMNKLFHLHEKFGATTDTISLLIIVLGCLIFFLSFLGFLGAIKNDNCLSLTYSVLMLTLLSFQVLLIVFIYADKGKLHGVLKASVEKAWKIQEADMDPSFMDVLQTRLQCCGVNGTNDYISKNYPVPPSCRRKNRGLTKDFLTGCAEAIGMFVDKYLGFFKSMVIAIAGLEILVFTLGCYVSGQPEELVFTSDLH